MTIKYIAPIIDKAVPICYSTVDLTYHWSFVSVPDGSTANLNPDKQKSTLTPDKDGKYIIRLIVHDGEIESIPDEVMIPASTPNATRIAKAGDDRFILIGDTITLRCDYYC